jgi:DNA-binding MarR family transcriptional regulator
LASVGLRTGQFSILSFISEYPADPSITQLADFLDMDLSTATRNLRPLIASGYVVPKTVSDDARRRELKLTARGARLLQKAYPLWSKVQAGVIKEFGSQHGELHTLLERLR